MPFSVKKHIPGKEVAVKSYIVFNNTETTTRTGSIIRTGSVIIRDFSFSSNLETYFVAIVHGVKNSSLAGAIANKICLGHQTGNLFT